MANGSKNPENPTDQKCPFCDLYFSSRGWKGHVLFCDAKEKDEPYPWEMTKAQKDKQNMSDKNEPDNEPDESPDKLVCPECGNPDNDNKPYIYLTDTNLKKWLKNNDYWENNKNEFMKNDYLCFDCNTFFNEGE